MSGNSSGFHKTVGETISEVCGDVAYSMRTPVCFYLILFFNFHFEKFLFIDFWHNLFFFFELTKSFNF